MNLRDLPWRRWMAVAVPVAVVALLLTLIVPAILRARTAARKTQSKNRLKNIGLALHNYYNGRNCFPPGAIVRDDGVALHGHMSWIAIYMDATPWYQFIRRDYSWDHDLNRFVFSYATKNFRISGVDQISTDDGYGLTHYMGNPNVFHRNSSVTFDEMTDGLAHTWSMAEAAGNYQPWGYPFNWRPLGRRLNAGPDSYGRPSKDGAFMLMADGRVKFVANEVDERILQNYADAPPTADAAQTVVPAGAFEDSTEEWVRDLVDLAPQQEEGWYAAACIDTDECPFAVVFFSKAKLRPERPPSAADLRRVAETFGDVKVLRWQFAIDDDMAEALTEFTNLEVVGASSLDVSRRGLEAIKRMPALKELIVGEISADDLAELREALPDCEIRFLTSIED